VSARRSRRWLREHRADSYVREARARGYRSRAAFKLIEIDDAERLLRPGARVLDLGAAPGGWSQVAAERVGREGRVVAVDRLPIEPIRGVVVLRGDLAEAAVRDRIGEQLGPAGADLLLCDMAPDLSGVAASDQARMVALGEFALGLAEQYLAGGGDLLMKVFQGEAAETLRAAAAARFAGLAVRKPRASRARSAELYLLARGHRGRG